MSDTNDALGYEANSGATGVDTAYRSSTTGTLGESGLDDTKTTAGDVAQTAKEEVGGAARTAAEETRGVAREAGTQLKDLYGRAKSEVRNQAAKQQDRATEGLRTAGQQFGDMASSSQGMAADVVQRLASGSDRAAAWLGQRDPEMVLEDVKRFARQRPGVFLGIALAVGVVAGRLARSLASAHQRENADDDQYRVGGQYSPGGQYNTGGQYAYGQTEGVRTYEEGTRTYVGPDTV